MLLGCSAERRVQRRAGCETLPTRWPLRPARPLQRRVRQVTQRNRTGPHGPALSPPLNPVQDPATQETPGEPRGAPPAQRPQERLLQAGGSARGGGKPAGTADRRPHCAQQTAAANTDPQPGSRRRSGHGRMRRHLHHQSTLAAERNSSPAGAACNTLMPRKTGRSAPVRCSVGSAAPSTPSSGTPTIRRHSPWCPLRSQAVRP
jgi:hypothetical protein